MIQYGIFVHGLAQQWRPPETKFVIKVKLRGEDDARTSNTRIAQRKRAIPHSMMKTHRKKWVTALCNQPEAFASDLGDDKSRYILVWQKSRKCPKRRVTWIQGHWRSSHGFGATTTYWP